MVLKVTFLQYSPAGDDGVSEAIGDLVRDKLCLCLQTIFEHGIQHAVLLGTQMHPWLFVEEVRKKNERKMTVSSKSISQVADKEINRHLESVYARINLCKAYK